MKSALYLAGGCSTLTPKPTKIVRSFSIFFSLQFFEFVCVFRFFSVADCYMIASTVSSKMLRSIAVVEGFHFEETLTGFKWIANRADALRKQGETVLFGFEEAIGFMCGDFVLDKDGVSACLIGAEMIAWLDSIGLTIQQQLNQLFEKYGYHITNNSYFLCYETPVIERMFERLRNYNGPNTVIFLIVYLKMFRMIMLIFCCSIQEVVEDFV